MRLLIVEDNAFNAFCLSRLLQTVNKQLKIKVANDGSSALRYLSREQTSLIILDGDLGRDNGLTNDGPALADIIWSNNIRMPIIAWSESEDMRIAFDQVFKKHNKRLDYYTCWPKKVNSDLVIKTLSFLLPKEPPYFIDRQKLRVVI